MKGKALRTLTRANSIHRDSSKDLSQARAQAVSRDKSSFHELGAVRLSLSVHSWGDLQALLA